MIEQIGQVRRQYVDELLDSESDADCSRHIYFTTTAVHRQQYTVLANPGPRAGLLAVNRHEKGLHLHAMLFLVMLALV